MGRPPGNQSDDDTGNPTTGTSGEELRDWVTQHLRSSRSPEVIEFRDELPYNDMGKLLRRVLRHELAHLGDV